MRGHDLRAFARRSWAELDAIDAAWWRARRQAAGAADAFRLADELRRFARAVRPGWPDESARARDLASHVALGEALRRVRGLGGS